MIESQIALSRPHEVGILFKETFVVMNRLQIEASVSRETEAILALQAHLKSGRLSKLRRDQLEGDLYNRIHKRYVAVQALKHLLSR